jgi:hypothetical protein
MVESTIEHHIYYYYLTVHLSTGNENLSALGCVAVGNKKVAYGALGAY